MQLFNQIKIQTLLEISLKFYRLEMPWLYVLVHLFQLVRYQSLSLPWAFTISVHPVKKTYINDFIP